MKLLIAIVIILFVNCNSTTNKKQNILESQTFGAAKYAEWENEKIGNIEFNYPQKWQVKIRQAQGTIQLGVTNDPDTSIVYFPIEIWQFNKNGQTFEDFSNVPSQYFVRATDGKRANLLNTTPTKFKNFEAKKFEFMKNNFLVEIITINGIKNYYMLVTYTNDTVSNYSNEIFNSIKILPE